MTNETVSCRVTGITHDLRGVARVGQRVWFVDGALPDEQVLAQPVKTAGSGQQPVDAVLVAVESDVSALRCEPSCEHYAVCGGCSVQHITYEGQVQLKQQALLQQIKRLGGVMPAQVLPPLLSSAWEYRRRARLSIRRDGAQGVVLGFRQRSSHAVVAVPHCRVLRPALRALLAPLQDCLSGWSSLKQLGHVDVLEVGTPVQVSVRVTSTPRDADLMRLRDFADSTGVTVWVETGDGEETQNVLVSGATVCDNTLPVDFFQGNADVNEAMVLAVQTALAVQPEDRVLDAFCGVGNFTLPLARQAASVTACDVVAGMVQRAAIRAKHHGIGNAVFRTVNLESPTEAARLHGVNKILLDPPRTGARQFCLSIPLSSVSRLVYVSCNPATLARDTAVLVQRGWLLSSVQLVDMFPQTAHMECIAVFHPAPRQRKKKVASRSRWS